MLHLFYQKVAQKWYLIFCYIGFLIAFFCSNIALAEEEPDIKIVPTVKDELLIIAHKNKPDLEGADKGNCFKVEKIRLSGEFILEEKKLRDAVHPFAYNCQNNVTLGAILKAINELHSKHGFLTTQGYFPPQDIIKSKEILISIVPGRVEKVIYTEDRAPYVQPFKRFFENTKAIFLSKSTEAFWKNLVKSYHAIDDELNHLQILPPRTKLITANIVKPNQVFQIEDVQQSLDTINSVGSSKAEAGLKPGKAPATSIVEIKNRVEDSFRLTAGYDTENIQGSDTLRFGFTATKDNLIGINDVWTTTLKSGIFSNELSGGLSFPYKRFTFSLNADYSESTSQLGAFSELFDQTITGTFSTNYLLQRTSKRRTVIGGTLSHRLNQRYVNAVELTPQRVSILAGHVAHTEYFKSGVLNANFGVSVGLRAFNATEDPDDADDTTPRAQFTKLTAGLSYSHILKSKTVLTSSLSGQYSPTALYSSDQMTIGSKSTVRGFSSAAFKADSGFYWRNDISFALPVDKWFSKSKTKNTWMKTSVSKINPYIFADLGYGFNIANDTEGTRIGAGVGLRFTGSIFNFDIGYAWRLNEPDDVAITDDLDGEAYATVRLKLF